MENIKVGVVGYSTRKFSEKLGAILIFEAFNQVERLYPGKKFKIVSGLTNIGIPKLAYEEAVRRGWETVGIACKKVHDYPKFPVNEEVIVGENWGDKSETFLSSIDILVKIGGGEQSVREANQFAASGRQVIEYKLPPL